MISIIFGANGRGKSSLMTHFLNESAYNRERIIAGQRAYKRLALENNFQAQVPQHFTYLTGGEGDAIFRKEGYRKRLSLALDAGKIGIQSEAPKDVQCQFIPEYATLGIDEAQTWFSSRDGQVQGYQFSFFEKHRHNNLDIYMTTTRAKLIDLRIRALSSGMAIRERRMWFKSDGSVKIEWIVEYIDVGYIDDYLDCPLKERKQFYSLEKVVCDYNVFKLYNPESCKNLFSKGYQDLKI